MKKIPNTAPTPQAPTGPFAPPDKPNQPPPHPLYAQTEADLAKLQKKG